MGCVTGDYLNNCAKKTIGGIATIFIADSSTVDGVTGGNGTPVTDVTMTALEVFYKFEFQRDEAVFTETIGENGVVTQTLTIPARGRSQELRNFIQALVDCRCGITVIHKENTGIEWIWGFDDGEEAFAPEGEASSGAAKADPNQESITLTASATRKADTFTGIIPV